MGREEETFGADAMEHLVEVWGETLKLGEPGDPGATLRLTRVDSDVVAEPVDLQDLKGEVTLGPELGRGGMGLVLEARQHSLEREVAAKTLIEGRDDGLAINAFYAEARITARLHHPNVVPIHTLGHDASGRPLLVMQRVSGRGWSELLAEEPPASGPAALSQHLDVFRAVLDALSFAHQVEVIHRDLKPENVMVGSFGQVYLVDWGLALELEDGQAEPGNPAGTLAYMAPEMAAGDRPLTKATDVYLLGAILHELLTGRPPHSGASLMNVLMAAIANEVLPLEPGFPAPAKLIELTARCLSTAPLERFASAGELREAWLRFVSGEESAEASKVACSAASELLDEVPTPGPYRPGVTLQRDEVALRYERLFQAEGYLQQALQAWPQNLEASALSRRALVVLTRTALAAGDLALAASLLPRATALGVEENEALESEVAAAQRFSDPEALAALDEVRKLQASVGGVGAAAAALFATCVGVVALKGSAILFSQEAQNVGWVLLLSAAPLGAAQLALHQAAAGLGPARPQALALTLRLLALNVALSVVTGTAMAALTAPTPKAAWTLVFVLYTFFAFTIYRRLKAPKLGELLSSEWSPAEGQGEL